MNIVKLIPSIITIGGVVTDILKSGKRETDFYKKLNAYEDSINEKFDDVYKEIYTLKNILRFLFISVCVLSFVLIIAFALIIFILKTRG